MNFFYIFHKISNFNGLFQYRSDSLLAEKISQLMKSNFLDDLTYSKKYKFERQNIILVELHTIRRQKL
ncbi:MAG TPA: hypothetical protein DDZ36_06190 [Deltaproteobacteria bacterium]|nr:hypothetical protein [Deltaproteobacteria bacterium]